MSTKFKRVFFGSDFEFSEYYGISENLALQIIEAGKSLHELRVNKKRFTIYNVWVDVPGDIYTTCVNGSPEKALDILETCLKAPKSCMQILEYNVIYEGK